MDNTTVKSKEALMSSCLALALADYFDSYTDKEIYRFREAMENYRIRYADQFPAKVQPLPTTGIEAAAEKFWNTNSTIKRRLNSDTTAEYLSKNKFYEFVKFIAGAQLNQNFKQP